MDEAKQALEALHATIAEITDSDAWREHLAQQAKFHNYSPLNIMFMLSQWERRRQDDPSLPEFSQAAGFTTWKDAGRWVRKGEKALAVLAPRIITDRENLDDEGKPTKKLIGFTIKRRTFEASQTDGEPLVVNPIAPVKLTGEGDPEVWGILVAYAESLGFSVSVESIPGPTNGWCNHRTMAIAIEADNDGAQRLKTLIHEIAHAIMHAPDSPTRPESQAEVEVEAESVAFVAATILGYDTADYSIGYVATWASRDDRGEVLRKTTERVVKTARTIAAAVEAARVGPEGVEVAA